MFDRIVIPASRYVNPVPGPLAKDTTVVTKS